MHSDSLLDEDSILSFRFFKNLVQTYTDLISDKWTVITNDQNVFLRSIYQSFLDYWGKKLLEKDQEMSFRLGSWVIYCNILS